VSDQYLPLPASLTRDLSNSVKFDGLMGLAQSGLSQQGQLTPIESLAAAGLIPAAITSYKISRLADKKNDGEITFGGLDPAKFVQSTLVTVNNVNTQGFWEGALDGVTVNGQNVGLQGRTAILDTGTTLLFAPTQVSYFTCQTLTRH
jgi:Eukaryotic aspartyl protease